MEREGSEMKGKDALLRAVESKTIYNWYSEAVTHLSALVGITLLNLLCSGSSAVESCRDTAVSQNRFWQQGKGFT